MLTSMIVCAKELLYKEYHYSTPFYIVMFTKLRMWWVGH